MVRWRISALAVLAMSATISLAAPIPVTWVEPERPSKVGPAKLMTPAPSMAPSMGPTISDAQWIPDSDPAETPSLTPVNLTTYSGTDQVVPPYGPVQELVPHVWFTAEYLLWWLKNEDTGPGGRLTYDQQSGFRVGVGTWFDADTVWGADFNFFQLQQKDADTTLPGFITPVPTGRVLDAVVALGPAAFGPGALALNSSPTFVRFQNRLWGLEANVRRRIPAVFFADRLELLVGFRHISFGEGADLITFNPVVIPGSFSADHVQVTSQFYGGQAGLISKHYCGPFSLEITGKLGIGGVTLQSRVDSRTVFPFPGNGNVVLPNSPLVDLGALGGVRRSAFTVVPELIVTGGYQVSDNLRFLVGYNFLSVNNVLRIGNALDAAIFTGALRTGNERFWAQGVNLGFEFTY